MVENQQSGTNGPFLVCLQLTRSLFLSLLYLRHCTHGDQNVCFLSANSSRVIGKRWVTKRSAVRSLTTYYQSTGHTPTPHFSSIVDQSIGLSVKYEGPTAQMGASRVGYQFVGNRKTQTIDERFSKPIGMRPPGHQSSNAILFLLINPHIFFSTMLSIFPSHHPHHVPSSCFLLFFFGVSFLPMVLPCDGVLQVSTQQRHATQHVSSTLFIDYHNRSSLNLKWHANAM